MNRKDNPDRKLTLKEQAFVEALPTTKLDASDAVEKVFQTKSRHVSNNMAHNMMKKPAIRKAIDELIKEKYGDAGDKIRDGLYQTIEEIKNIPDIKKRAETYALYVELLGLKPEGVKGKTVHNHLHVKKLPGT